MNAVRRTLSRVPGVASVQVDLAAGRARVEGDTDAARLIAAVEKAGYEAALISG